MTKARNIADLGSNDVIETTATGVDVTGTVTADGLTVDGGGTIEVGSGGFNGRLNFPYSGRVNIDSDNNGTGEKFTIGSNQTGDGATNQIAVFRESGNVEFYEDTGTTAKMVWDASAGQLQLSGTDGSQLRIYANGGGGSYWDLYSLYGGTNPELRISNSVSGDVITATSSGNVGIGTASPATTTDIRTLNGSDAKLRIGSSSGIGLGTVGTLEFYSADPDNAGVKSFIRNEITGNVGPGGSQRGNIVFGTATTGDNATENMRLDSSGNLLVGKTSTDITGNGVVLGTGAQSFTSTNGQYSYRITTNGGVGLHHFYSDVGGTQTLKSYVRTDGNYVQLSDYRLKENITPIENAVDKVNKLKPVTYTWKNTEGKEAHGFIAHEFKEVLPNEVDGNKDQVKEDGTPFYQAINISAAIPLLVKAMQEQQEVIESLKTRIETLENN